MEKFPGAKANYYNDDVDIFPIGWSKGSSRDKNPSYMCSGGSRISQIGEGRQSLYLGQKPIIWTDFCIETAWKSEEIGWGGQGIPSTPLDPPMTFTFSCSFRQWCNLSQRSRHGRLWSDDLSQILNTVVLTSWNIEDCRRISLQWLIGQFARKVRLNHARWDLDPCKRSEPKHLKFRNSSFRSFSFFSVFNLTSPRLNLIFFISCAGGIPNILSKKWH